MPANACRLQFIFSRAASLSCLDDSSLNRKHQPDPALILVPWWPDARAPEERAQPPLPEPPPRKKRPPQQ